MTVAFDVLRELRCATVREVAERLGVKYSTALTYLKRLVNKGLVEKRGVGRHILYCVVKDVDVVPRGGYKLYTKTRVRMVRVIELLQRDGCVSVAGLMRIMRISHSEAYHMLRVLLLTRQGVKMRIGNTAILCRDRVAAEEAVARIRETVHRLAVANGMRYATAAKILQVALIDREAYELLSRLIPLRRSTTRFPPLVLTFVNDVLQSLYGEPLKRRHGRVYVVTQPRAGHDIEIADSIDKQTIAVNLPSDIAEMIQDDAKQTVLQAIEQLLQKYKT
jgi:DNA-binding Lrp family transcriptional regulator